MNDDVRYFFWFTWHDVFSLLAALMSSSEHRKNGSSESALDELTALSQALGLYDDLPNPIRTLRHAPVLFLGVDGVLHPRDVPVAVDDAADAPTGQRAAGLFRHCELLAELLAPYPDVQVVVHSNWRRRHAYGALRAFLGPVGPLLVDVTRPDLDCEGAIIDFMRHRNLAAEAVVVLDDQVEKFNLLRTRIVASDPQLGVSDVDARIALTRMLATCYLALPRSSL